MNSACTKSKLTENASSLALAVTRRYARDLAGLQNIPVDADVLLLSMRVLTESLLVMRQHLSVGASLREVLRASRGIALASKQISKIAGMLPTPKGRRPPTWENLLVQAQRRNSRKGKAKIAEDPGAQMPETGTES